MNKITRDKIQSFDFESMIRDCIDTEYVDQCGGNAKQIVTSEYGYNFGRVPSDKVARDYLQGLPSLCTVPFYNGEIMELLGFVTDQLSDDDSADIIASYWLQCGKAFVNVVFRGV